MQASARLGGVVDGEVRLPGSNALLCCRYCCRRKTSAAAAAMFGLLFGIHPLGSVERQVVDASLVGWFVCSSPGTAGEALFAAFGRSSRELRDECVSARGSTRCWIMCVRGSARCWMMCFVFITCPVAHARLLETAVCCVL